MLRTFLKVSRLQDIWLPKHANSTGCCTLMRAIGNNRLIFSGNRYQSNWVLSSQISSNASVVLSPKSQFKNITANAQVAWTNVTRSMTVLVSDSCCFELEKYHKLSLNLAFLCHKGHCDKSEDEEWFIFNCLKVSKCSTQALKYRCPLNVLSVPSFSCLCSDILSFDSTICNSTINIEPHTDPKLKPNSVRNIGWHNFTVRRMTLQRDSDSLRFQYTNYVKISNRFIHATV